MARSKSGVTRKPSLGFSASASRTAFSVTSKALTSLRRMRPAISTASGVQGVEEAAGSAPASEAAVAAIVAAPATRPSRLDIMRFPLLASDVWSASVISDHCEPKGVASASRAKARR